jgi:hypothetical protein
MNVLIRGRAVVALLCLALAGTAHAGNAGAGPAGSAASAVGSIVTPGSNTALDTAAKDDHRRRVVAGNGGHIVLTGDQLTTTAEMLRGFAGAELVGSIIRAPTVLADGTPAVIALNTRTGELTVIRRR